MVNIIIIVLESRTKQENKYQKAELRCRFRSPNHSKFRRLKKKNYLTQKISTTKTIQIKSQIFFANHPSINRNAKQIHLTTNLY